MKKILLMLLLSTALILSACGKNTDSNSNGNATGNSGSTNGTNESTEGQEATSEDKDADSSELESLGDVSVDKGSSEVELTIPATYVDGQTQEDLDLIRETEGYKSITLNDDGSATYVMTKKQHETMMAEMANTINDAMKEMVGSDDYPNITEVKANDTFTEFTVTTKSEELDMSESFTYIMFYMYGGMYNIFNGSESDDITVTYINADTGETISSSNSADLAE
ncbi:MAG: hypothetical protein K0R05_2445 [Anaerocolumna sp.]|jgi:hypothetical protein|nr:hypothetical protein [Anaerocolumna sp.]